MRHWFESNLFLKVLSLGLAVITWIYVTNG